MDTITYMFSYFSISAQIARILLVTFYGGGYFLSILFIPTSKVLEKIVRMPVTQVDAMIYTSRKQWNKPRGKYLVYASKCLIQHGKHQLLSLTFYKICRCPQIGGRQENIHEEDMIKLLLVDDQTIVRQGLRRRLLLEPDISVVGEASSGEQALELVQALDPDIVLMDVEMPGMDGITATATMHDHASQCTVVMLSIHDDVHTRTRALAAGAAAFVEKRGAVEVLLATIRQAAVPGRT